MSINFGLFRILFPKYPTREVYVFTKEKQPKGRPIIKSKDKPPRVMKDLLSFLRSVKQGLKK